MTSSDPPTRPSMRIPKVMHVDSAMFLNGMTTIQPQPHITAGQSNQLSTPLITDFLLSVYHFSLQTLSYSIVLNNSATMAPPPHSIPAIGINGLHYRPADGNLYYINSLRERFNRVLSRSLEIHQKSRLRVNTLLLPAVFSATTLRLARTGCLHCCKSDERGLRSGAEG